jgi:hypothetical protein
MGSLSFGLVAGFIIKALPFLLARAGVSVDRIAGVSARCGARQGGRMDQCREPGRRGAGLDGDDVVGGVPDVPDLRTHDRAGITYAAFSAWSLQLVGIGNPPAATQLGLFAASTNGAIVYMTWADGLGYGLFGAKGLFLVDGLASLGAAIPLLMFLRWRAERARAAREAIPAGAALEEG